MKPDNEKSDRLFFALWPDPILRQSLVEIQSQVSVPGRPIAAEQLHLTLVFLGDVSEAQQEKLVRSARNVTVPQFTIQLDSVGYFKRSQVQWVGPAQTPGPCADLHHRLVDVARESGVAVASEVFSPHVTLRRKVQASSSGQGNTPERITPLEWQIQEFCLVRSELSFGGSKYSVLNSFLLQPS